MTGPLTDRVRLLHILDAIAEVENYLHGVGWEQFPANSKNASLATKPVKRMKN